MSSGKFFASPPQSSIVLDRPASDINPWSSFESSLCQADLAMAAARNCAQVRQVVRVTLNPTGRVLGAGNDVIDLTREGDALLAALAVRTMAKPLVAL